MFNLCRFLMPSLALVLLMLSVGVKADPDEQAEASGAAKMEAGVVLVGQVSADYRGSIYYSPRALPLPYFLYSGPIIKADRDGVRGEFFKTPKLRFNVSMDGSLGGSGSDNPVRENMPQLESAIEIGPSLDVLLSGESFREGWSMRLPLRGVFAIGSGGVNYVGFLANPRLTWRSNELLENWRVSVSVAALVADADYHNYYYGVSEPYVNEQRPLYEARGGYSGSYLKLNVFRSWNDDWRFAVSLRYDNLAGAKFTTSPLFQTKHYGSVSFALIRRFWSNLD